MISPEMEETIRECAREFDVKPITIVAEFGGLSGKKG